MLHAGSPELLKKANMCGRSFLKSKLPFSFWFLPQPPLSLNWLRCLSSVIHIEGGRHAVAEHELRRDGRIFVPNDTHLDNRSLLHIVTGPNM